MIFIHENGVCIDSIDRFAEISGSSSPTIGMFTMVAYLRGRSPFVMVKPYVSGARHGKP
jgi:hypothetical protein